MNVTGSIAGDFSRYEAARQIYSVLVMHFQEGVKQSEIAEITGLSTAKVISPHQSASNRSLDS